MDFTNLQSESNFEFFSGIGSRQTPPEICNIISKIGNKLQKVKNPKQLILRSGRAEGADKAFEKYVHSENKIIYTPQNFNQNPENLDICIPELESILDPGIKLKNMRPFIKLLLLRDINQVLGDPENGWQKSKFLICWVPTENYSLKEAGGSRYAIRCALKHGIKVYNLLNEQTMKMVCEWLKISQEQNANTN